MAGAFAIIQDPIFQGMAVSLFFGAGVATIMAVIVIPLGCISLRKHFYLEETESGEIELSGRYAEVEEVAGGRVPAAPTGTPIWLSLWRGLVALVTGFVGILGTLLVSIWRLLLLVVGLFRKRRAPPRPRPPGPGSSSPAGGTSPSGGAAPAGSVGTGGDRLQPSTVTSAVSQDLAVDAMKSDKASASTVKSPETTENTSATAPSPKPLEAETSRSPLAGTTLNKKKAGTSRKKTSKKKTASGKKQVVKKSATKKTTAKKAVMKKTSAKQTREGADTGAPPGSAEPAAGVATKQETAGDARPVEDETGVAPSSNKASTSASRRNRDAGPGQGMAAEPSGSGGAFGRGAGVRRVLELKVKREGQS
jgi:hypothetical protein